MQIAFWSFSKRQNSTKRPSTDGEVISFVYKEMTDMHNPSITISKWNNTWNYAKIGTIYFFVDSCEVVASNTFTAHLKIDVLATYKETILATSAHVLYSANNYNKNLVDNRIITSGHRALVKTVGKTPITNAQGTFMLTVSSATEDYSYTGVTTTYFLTNVQMTQLAFQLNKPDAWESISQWFKNPVEAMVELSWLPIDAITGRGMSSSEIIIGKYKTGVNGYLPKTGWQTLTQQAINGYTLEIPWQFDDFRNLSPYTTLTLYHPMVGLIPLNPEDFYGDASLTCQWVLDILTGEVQVWVHNSQNIVTTASGNVKAVLPIAQVQTRMSSLVSGTAGAVATAALFASGHPAAAVTSGAYAVANVLVPNQMYNNGGLHGSFIGGTLHQAPAIYLSARMTSENPQNLVATVGGVCGKVMQLSACSGYVKTDSASVAINGYVTESNTINSMLNGGAYIE